MASFQSHPLTVTLKVYDAETQVCLEMYRFSVALLGDGAGPRQGELEVAARVAAVCRRYGARVEIVQEQAGPQRDEPRYPASDILRGGAAGKTLRGGA